ncbi:serine hydrolase domain-containing protein [Telmatospirillum siberiense]|uniref:Serine hydrolase n=1 Tax=Telmatospirillum siberiense TaxID=382514 RepID=A0A2N3PW37_9PROT|nr:serine hydrolase domain-containing protein [Telmatospirillum siberiense]PKU24598.1 serine hydrolase [Telmatospirillum siberiense]
MKRELLRSFIAAIVISLTLNACGTLSTWEAEPPKERIEPDLSNLPQEVESLAGPLTRQGQTPGLIVGLLLPDGSCRFFGYGSTTSGGGETPGPDTLFAVGSLSKGFLGGITATLVQEKRLSWSDTLPALLPPGTPLSSDAARISLEQLATHTSGLPRQPATLRTLAYFVEYLFTGDNFYRHLDRDTVLDYLSDFSAPSDPNPQYSNIGYGILGDVVERRTGQTLDELLAQRITGPLGLPHTGYDPEKLPGYASRAIGHAGDQPKFIRRGEPVPDWRMTGIMRGSAAIYSTARDLLNFAGAHVRKDGSPLSSALAGNLRIRFARPREAAAIAWIADDVGDTRILYQVGLIAGYTSYLAVNETNGTAVVVLQNAFNWDYSLGHKLMLLLATPPKIQSE